MNFPKRELLSFFRVRALPNDSSRGFADRTRSERVGEEETEDEGGSGAFDRVTVARYCMINFVASVFPAPDSPDIIMDWLEYDSTALLGEEEGQDGDTKSRRAFSATLKRCGGNSCGERGGEGGSCAWG